MTDEPRVIVSDRAVLRHLALEHDIDVEAIREAIGTACTRGVQAGAPVVRVDDARFLLRGRVVVTCFGKEAHVGYRGMIRLMQRGRRSRK